MRGPSQSSPPAIGELQDKQEHALNAAVGGAAEGHRAEAGAAEFGRRGAAASEIAAFAALALQMRALHGGGDADGEYERVVHGIGQAAVARQRRVDDFDLLLAFPRHEAVSGGRPARVFLGAGKVVGGFWACKTVPRR
ncbi:protein of unknown function [Aminobacter niigataensis]|nr:protein of unknown function [Aminobacter niigataensis]